MIDALRYVGGLSHNTPTRSMLLHLEKRGLIAESSPDEAARGFILSMDGRHMIEQAEAYFSSRMAHLPASVAAQSLRAHA